MTAIGNMLWRIGELLEIREQLAWTREAGFGGVGLHASAGVPGKWRGVEPSTCGIEERRRLRRDLAAFAFVEIHAPFAIDLRVETLGTAVAELAPVLAFAGDLGARVVTVHAHPPVDAGAADDGVWEEVMRDIDAEAARAETTVALEITDGFAAVARWDLPHVRVNLDVGHMYLPPNRAGLAAHGGIGALIRELGSTLGHLHLHDVRDEVDHVEIGTGEVAFDEIARGLRDIGYAHNVTLELNPDRVSPEGMRRSAQRVAECLRDEGRG